MRTRKIVSAVIVSVAIAIAATVTPVAAYADTAAQVQLLRQAGVQVSYRAATPADHRLKGAYLSVRPLQSRCSAGFICLYWDGNGASAMFAVRGGDSLASFNPMCNDSVCYDFNDEMSSWENVSGWTYCWFFDAGYRGERHFMQYHGYVIVNLNEHENDEASSLRALGLAEHQARC